MISNHFVPKRAAFILSDYNVLRDCSAYNTDTTPTQPHRNSNTHQTKNNTTNVVIQQNSRKLLMMYINVRNMLSALEVK